jgi:ribosomal protein S18 acetylase RimI-like enzyme
VLVWWASLTGEASRPHDALRSARKALGARRRPSGPVVALDCAPIGSDSGLVRAVASSVAERISLAEDALAEAGAEVLRLPYGRVIRQPAFPHVYDANLVRRVRLRENGLDDALEELSLPLRQIGARHLQLTLDGSDVPEGLSAQLRRRGFVRDRLLVMTLEGPAARPRTPGVRLREVPREATWDQFGYAMDRMNREEAWYAPSVSREIIGSLRYKCELGALQLFVAERDGRTAGTVGLARQDRVASVVSVGTLPDARGRGVGATMVVDMVERARTGGAAELVYLIARADDSPKDMYRKLGFHVELGFDVWLRLPR